MTRCRKCSGRTLGRIHVDSLGAALGSLAIGFVLMAAALS